MVPLLIGVLAVFIAIYGVHGVNNTQEEKKKVIFVPKIMDKTNGFWTSLIEGAELGAEEFNMNLEVIGGISEEGVDEQIQFIKESIEKKPDALLVAPCSYSETSEVLKEAVENGIQLVLIDSIIDCDISSAVVATDNYAAGKELGAFANTIVNDEEEIGVIAHVKGTSTAIDREAGMRSGLGSKEENIKEVMFCGSSYEKAYEQAKAMIEQHPKLGMIMCTNEYASVGAARAIKELGLAEKIKIVGFDNSIEEIQLLEAGVFQGIVIQKPFNMGYLGMKQANDILEGKEIEKNTDSGCKLITKENLYEEENQRLLYPFIGQD